MRTHETGRLFCHLINVRWYTPPLHRAETRESRYPYRWSKSVIIRFSYRKALVVGWWRDADPTESTESLLLKALIARVLTEDSPLICSPQTCGRTHDHAAPPSGA